MGAHRLRASLLLMKRKKAGSQTSLAWRHASTHDWPSEETSSRRALRGGQEGGALMLGAQPRPVELGRATKGHSALPDLLLDELAGGYEASGVQKSYKGSHANQQLKCESVQAVPVPKAGTCASHQVLTHCADLF